MWGRNERVESKVTPRLRMWGDGMTVEPSILRVKLWAELVREFGPMSRISDLLQLSFRKLFCIQVLMSLRQVVRVECVAAVMVLVERYSWVSSA